MKNIEKLLRDLGFQYDPGVTYKAEYRWYGTIDTIACMTIDGDCTGISVSGDTKKEMDAEALEMAQHYSQFLSPCTNPDCEFHYDRG